MKAVQVVRPGELSIVERQEPTIQQGDEVLMKVRMAGICGSDMHIYHGTSPVATYPRVIGHEVVGEIIEVGSETKQIKPGDKVVLEPIQSCGSCYACRAGRRNVCEHLQVYGVHLDGGYQHYMVLPERNVHKIADHLDWQTGVLIEPFTIGAQAAWRGDVRPGDVVFIMGAGPIGLCALHMSKIRGATCIISDISDAKLAYAAESGADYTLNARKADVRNELLRITGGLGPNVTIDAVCTEQTFEEAVDVTSVAGRVVVLGFGDAPSRIPQLPITKKELTIVGSRLQSNQFGYVIDLFNRGMLQPQSFITHHYPVEEIQRAMQLIETHPNEVRKVVVEF